MEVDGNNETKIDAKELLEFFRPHSLKLPVTSSSCNVITLAGRNFRAWRQARQAKRSLNTKYSTEPVGRQNRSEQQTLAAMRLGEKIIANGTLYSENFACHPNYLVQVAGDSLLGKYHYEVWTSVKGDPTDPALLIELCCHAEALAKLQGRLPQHVRIAVVNGEILSYQTDDLMPLYLVVRGLFFRSQGVDRRKRSLAGNDKLLNLNGYRIERAMRNYSSTSAT
jgi:predicted RecB family nuclease